MTPEEKAQITARTVHVTKFTCDDPIVSEAVQNLFIAELAEMGFILTTDDSADLIITGTITTTFDELTSGQSSSLGWGGVRADRDLAKGGAVAGGSGSFSQSAGKYVTGISSLAAINGRIVASGTHSQTRFAGRLPDPPEAVAKRAAVDLRWKLGQAKNANRIIF